MGASTALLIVQTHIILKKMKLLNISIFAVTSAITVTKVDQKEADLQKWIDFKTKFNKSYKNDEEDNRFNIFVNHLRKHEKHNAKINKYSDMDWEEFSTKVLMNLPKPTLKNRKVGESLPYPEEPWEMECPERFQPIDWEHDQYKDFTTECDWRTNTTNPLGVVADLGVKDQAHCGSCYVFSAVAAMESSLCRQGFYDCNTWIGLSEQDILNCATYDETMGDRVWERSHGCSGGWQSNVYQYVYKAGGITSGHMSEYLSGHDDAFPNKYNVGHCPYTWENKYEYMQETSHGFIGKNICGTTNKGGEADADLMKQALASKGVLTNGMYVGDNFRHVEDGIYNLDLEDDSGDCPNLSTAGINHAMAAVAYGTSDDGEDYWVIKNSWGESFSMGGYVKVTRGSNICGIEGNISYAYMDSNHEEEDESLEKHA